MVLRQLTNSGGLARDGEAGPCGRPTSANGMQFGWRRSWRNLRALAPSPSKLGTSSTTSHAQAKPKGKAPPGRPVAMADASNAWIADPYGSYRGHRRQRPDPCVPLRHVPRPPVQQPRHAWPAEVTTRGTPECPRRNMRVNRLATFFTPA